MQKLQFLRVDHLPVINIDNLDYTFLIFCQKSSGRSNKQSRENDIKSKRFETDSMVATACKIVSHAKVHRNTLCILYLDFRIFVFNEIRNDFALRLFSCNY